jgi:APA family basic amino acid/polyamine antiporter
VSVGWSRYTVSFIEDVFSITLSNTFIQSPIVFENEQFIVTGNYFNAPAVVIALCLTVLLMFGVKESAFVNNIAVAIKLVVILLFIFACFTHVKKENFQPFIPEREDGKYGVLGQFFNIR